MSTWPKVRLDECCEIVGGSTPSTSVPSYWGGSIPWATPKDLSDLDGATISDTPRKLTEAGLRATSSALLPAGSVLFSSRAPIGHVALNTVPMATNQGFKSFIPQAAKVHAPFLYWWLRTHRTYLEGLGNGATFKEVSKTVVSRIEIQLPSLAEQRRIADVLDRVEALRAKRRAVIARLSALTQSIFLDMFGDPATNPKGWPAHPLGDVVAEVQIGPFGSLMHQSDYVDGGIPLVNPMHIVDGKIVVNAAQAVRPEKAQSLTRYWLREGDIVIGRRGEMGRCAVVGKAETGMICGSGSAVIRPDIAQARPTFLQALLSTSAIKALLERKALGVTMLNLNSAIIADVLVMIPPMTLQVAYEGAVHKLETTIQASVTSLTHLDALFASLQHRAFRGEL